MVVDAIIFNGEYDLLEIRLNILNEYVDQFIIVEATTTFSGKPKELYYEKEKERFAKFADKIKYFITKEPFSERVMALADGSPNVPKGMHWWHREFCQRESTREALKDLNDDDICFVSDCDEIWNPDVLFNIKTPSKMEQVVYSYYLNNKSSEAWRGTFVATCKQIKNGCINHLRSDTKESTPKGGWHFTNMGDEDFIKRKIESYGHQEFNTDSVKNGIKEMMEKNKDFLGRGFTFTIDESELPQYILDNKHKYLHLWKQ